LFLTFQETWQNQNAYINKYWDTLKKILGVLLLRLRRLRSLSNDERRKGPK